MPKEHVVKPGECLFHIAKQYGFGNYRTIYDHPDNAAFRKRRPDPNLIFPGDRLEIPDPEPKKVECSVGRSHRFQLSTPTRKLVLHLQDSGAEPLSAQPYTLKIEGKTMRGSTDTAGGLEVTIPATAQEATLEVGALSWELRIGHLNPMESVDDDVSGIQARLTNLGLSPGPIDGKLGPRTRASIREFQGAHDIDLDGEISSTLVDKLRDVYGC